jgi:hypothetical protein
LQSGDAENVVLTLHDSWDACTEGAFVRPRRDVHVTSIFVARVTENVREWMQDPKRHETRLKECASRFVSVRILQPVQGALAAMREGFQMVSRDTHKFERLNAGRIQVPLHEHLQVFPWEKIAQDFM